MVWAAAGAYQFARMAGDPDRMKILWQSLVMALFNLGAGLFLQWLKDRRGRGRV